MRILVTGGDGFICSALTWHLSAAGHDVWSYDAYVAEEVRHDDAGSALTVVPGDVLDAPHLFATVARVRPDVIVHGAAVVGPPASIVRPAHVVRVNVLGSTNVLEAARHHEVGRVVDLSSEEVYGHFTADEIDEDHPRDPTSPYGVTKLAVEQLGGQYATHFGLGYVAGRVCWAYGHGYRRDRAPQSWIRDALAGRASVLARGGDHLLDLTYVDDVAQGLRLLCEAPSLSHRAYHITSGQAVTLRELAAELSAILPDWEHDIGGGSVDMGAGFIAARKGALRIDRATAELGYAPAYDLRSGLRANVDRLRVAG